MYSTCPCVCACVRAQVPGILGPVRCRLVLVFSLSPRVFCGFMAVRQLPYSEACYSVVNSSCPSVECSLYILMTSNIDDDDDSFH